MTCLRTFPTLSKGSFPLAEAVDGWLCVKNQMVVVSVAVGTK